MAQQGLNIEVSSETMKHNSVELQNKIPHIKITKEGNSLVLQWLGLCAFTAEVSGSTPGQGTKIPRATRCGKKKLQRDLSRTGFLISPESSSTHHSTIFCIKNTQNSTE